MLTASRLCAKVCTRAWMLFHANGDPGVIRMCASDLKTPAAVTRVRCPRLKGCDGAAAVRRYARSDRWHHNALEAQATMNRQALDSEKIRDGLRDIPLEPGNSYEALRSRPAGMPVAG